jgi:uncharacterized small protein (DUF1192 family)
VRPGSKDHAAKKREDYAVMRDEDSTGRAENPLAPRHYDGWSVGDFAEHIAALKAEISRAEAAQAAKQASLQAAAGFFKTP